MKVAILNKIRRELNTSVNSEAKVLYLLAEIRKYIDRCSPGKKNKYPNLYFYCNWVLHIKMDRTPAKKILDRFESAILGINDLKKNIENLERSGKRFLFICKPQKGIAKFL